MIKRMLMILLLATICIAQDAPTPPKEQPIKKNIVRFPDRDYIEEVPVRTNIDGVSVRMTKRLLFVHDCSGSMGKDDLKIALNFIEGVMMQPLDEFEISVLAFDDNVYRWPGIPEPKLTPPVPPNWATLPSKIAVQKASQWIQNLNDNGPTFIIPALEIALREKRDDLSIVVVSDGGFHNKSSEILDAIEKGQKWREENKLCRALIMAVGVNSTPNHYLTKIGEAGGLGYFYPKPEPKTEEFEDDPR